MANQKNQPKQVSFQQANQSWIQTIDSLLFALDQPVNSSKAKQDEIKDNLYRICKEALEITQRELIRNATVPNGVKGDMYGWTTATTDYDRITKFKQARLVNTYLADILKKQEDKALAAGVGVSEAQIIEAQQDALNDEKSDITLKTIDKDGEQASILQIDKETGDTTIYEKNLETGEFEKKGVLKRYWQNVKDFCSNIWTYITDMWKGAVKWIKGLFKTPDDSEVIQKAA